jgi:hypothetical protein
MYSIRDIALMKPPINGRGSRKDTEREPPLAMPEPFDWEGCKAFFVRDAHAIVLRD